MSQLIWYLVKTGIQYYIIAIYIYIKLVSVTYKLQSVWINLYFPSSV